MQLLQIQFVDHPLILLPQFLVGVGLLFLFLLIRKDPIPLPQFMLALAISVFVGLAARATDRAWFYIAEIAESWFLAIVVLTAILGRLHRNKIAAKIPGAAVVIPGFFDRYRVQLVAVFGAVGFIILMAAYVKTYNDKQVALKEKETAKIDENTRVTAEYAREQCERDERDAKREDSLKQAMQTFGYSLSVVAKTTTELKAGQKAVEKKIDEKSAQTRATVRKETGKVLEQTKSSPTTNDQNQNQNEKPKRNMFDRIRGIFGNNRTGADADNSASADSVLRDYSLRTSAIDSTRYTTEYTDGFVPSTAGRYDSNRTLHDVRPASFRPR